MNAFRLAWIYGSCIRLWQLRAVALFDRRAHVFSSFCHFLDTFFSSSAHSPHSSSFDFECFEKRREKRKKSTRCCCVTCLLRVLYHFHICVAAQCERYEALEYLPFVCSFHTISVCWLFSLPFCAFVTFHFHHWISKFSTLFFRFSLSWIQFCVITLFPLHREPQSKIVGTHAKSYAMFFSLFGSISFVALVVPYSDITSCPNRMCVLSYFCGLMCAFDFDVHEQARLGHKIWFLLSLHSARTPTTIERTEWRLNSISILIYGDFFDGNYIFLSYLICTI